MNKFKRIKNILENLEAMGLGGRIPTQDLISAYSRLSEQILGDSFIGPRPREHNYVQLDSTKSVYLVYLGRSRVLLPISDCNVQGLKFRLSKKYLDKTEGGLIAEKLKAEGSDMILVLTAKDGDRKSTKLIPSVPMSSLDSNLRGFLERENAESHNIFPSPNPNPHYYV